MKFTIVKVKENPFLKLHLVLIVDYIYILIILIITYLCIFLLLFQACSQIQHGILALFGPSDLLLGTHVQSLCDALDIPHLEAR